MELLTDKIRSRLPPIHSQEAELDPEVHAHFFLPGTGLHWFVLEGEPDGDDFLFFAFVTGPDAFHYVRLSDLLGLRSPGGQPVECDQTFVPGRLTDVCPAPGL
jgi:hypothetical protein